VIDRNRSGPCHDGPRPGGLRGHRAGRRVLNEVNCEGTDWVELVNTAAQPAQIAGWLLTDDPLGSTRADHRMLFGDPTEIPPNGTLVVSKGSGGFAFGISCGGDTIRLADQAEAGVDEIAVPDLATPGNTWGRYPNGTGDWTETTPTQGAANEPAAGEGPPPDPAGWIFDPATVVEVGMELPPESIDALGESPGPEQHGPGPVNDPRGPELPRLPRGRDRRAAHGLRMRPGQRRRLWPLPQPRDPRRGDVARLV
jgi:hypothetical protein